MRTTTLWDDVMLQEYNQTFAIVSVNQLITCRVPKYVDMVVFLSKRKTCYAEVVTYFHLFRFPSYLFN